MNLKHCLKSWVHILKFIISTYGLGYLSNHFDMYLITKLHAVDLMFKKHYVEIQHLKVEQKSAYEDIYKIDKNQ